MPKTGRTKNPGGVPTAGWKFWIVCFVLFFPPSFYLAYQSAYDDRKAGLLPWVLGFSMAAVLAGLLTWAVNSVLHWHAQRQRRKTKTKTGLKRAGQ